MRSVIRWLIVGALVVAAFALGYAWRGLWDSSRSVSVNGTVIQPDPGRVCVDYDPESVSPKKNVFGLPRSDSGVCGRIVSPLPVGTRVHGTLMQVGEGKDAYVVWVALEPSP